MSGTVTTYAEALEKALEEEMCEERIWKGVVARREARKTNQGDHKRKPQEGQSNGVDKKLKGEGEVEASNKVVKGQIYIYGVKCKVLFDSGATNSYVSLDIADRLRLNVKRFANSFVTTLPLGELMLSSRWFQAVPIKVEEREHPRDSVEFNMKDYDVILGMDWLTKFGATIDCRRKIVTFRPEEGEQFTFMGEITGVRTPIISALKARSMIQKVFQAFIACIVDKTKETQLRHRDVRIVCEFPGVFPEDLPKLPPDREIEFIIKLAPGTAPISKAPYKMAPTEVKELKLYIEELLNNGFIRPSHSQMPQLLSWI
ncbi:uncharacterized protein LOC133799841 [Humulus lupulus]|uniref:uncharacterized protein LOC133799841 n=1 Tax=Humulus lupulus TaxID=3486 RepID=UPI002B4020DB|nr:uncharacterized protein LOC133799841 [Humulus lupulus]